MGDDIEFTGSAEAPPIEAKQPETTVKTEGRSKVEELARRLAAKAPNAAETAQEILPPGDDEYVGFPRDRQQGDEAEGGRRRQFLRRVLSNRRFGDDGDDGGRPPRLLRELEDRVRRLEDELDSLLLRGREHGMSDRRIA